MRPALHCITAVHALRRQFSSSPGELTRGPIVREGRCKFQCATVRITHAEQVPAALDLVKCERKVAKASHPTMFAWKIGSDRGSSDGGERGAARVLEDALEQSGRDEMLLNVTRWYGGRPLGGARFRAIKRVALDHCREGLS